MRSSGPGHWGGTRAQDPGRLRAQEIGNSLLGLLWTRVWEASVTSNKDATEACTSEPRCPVLIASILQGEDSFNGLV